MWLKDDMGDIWDFFEYNERGDYAETPCGYCGRKKIKKGIENVSSNFEIMCHVCFKQLADYVS